jgi:ABC-type phosphate transport system substrate-binding protein
MVAFSYLYVPVHPADAARARALAEFIRWVITRGQSHVANNGYYPLPSAVVTRIDAKLKRFGQ